MIRIYCIDPHANKWVYEYDGEIVAVEYSRQMAVACGEARVKALQANTACTGLAPAVAPESNQVVAQASNANRWADPERLKNV